MSRRSTSVISCLEIVVVKGEIAMDTVAVILKEKGTAVYTIDGHATVHDAAVSMSERRIGALLVCEKDAPVGIFTERDLLKRVVLPRLDPATVTVGEVMTRNPVCIGLDQRVKETMAIMTERRTRHLPVVEGGKVVGMVSIGDLVRFLSRSQEFEIHRLTEYILGTYPA